MTLLPEERLDRKKVNEAVRDGLRLGPLRPAGTADAAGLAFRPTQSRLCFKIVARVIVNGSVLISILKPVQKLDH